MIPLIVIRIGKSMETEKWVSGSPGLRGMGDLESDC